MRIAGSSAAAFPISSPAAAPSKFRTINCAAALTYGNQLEAGIQRGIQFSYDVQHSLFQGSVAQVGYNTNCFGLSFEVSQFNIGARVESRFRFAFTLKDIGSLARSGPEKDCSECHFQHIACAGLRRTQRLRNLVRETRLSPESMIYPIFVCPGEKSPQRSQFDARASTTCRSTMR